MKMGVIVIAFGFFLCSVYLPPAAGVTYRLTDEEYDRLPPLFQVDSYDRCLRARSQYCSVIATLHGHNQLYTTLQEYSANKIQHYNHTLVHRGVCLQSSCREYMDNSTDSASVAEACLNATFTRDYQLSIRVIKSYCSQHSETGLDATDYGFGVVILVLLGLNVLGSMYHLCCGREQKSFGGKLLYSFSIKRNWGQLVSPNSKVTDPMMRRLKCLSCFKTISTFIVLLAHSGLRLFFASNNPQFIERIYDSLLMRTLLCGPVVVQTFFLISGFLMAYNMLTTGRKRWWMLPKRVLLRWMRLTPPYALVMFFVMTWARYASDGPFWKRLVMAEAGDCRRHWWLNLLYVQNYVDHSHCMTHTWYLSADMQLSVLGLIIFCVWNSAKARKTAIAAVFVIGLLTPVAVMILEDLPPILITSPEVALNMFVEDPEFNMMYKRGHTNLVCYAMGMGLAFLVYNLQDSDIGSEKYKKFRLLYAMTPPLELLTVVSGMVFFSEDLVIPRALSAVYCAAIKPLFGLLICIHIFFTVVKVDSVCRGFLNWGGWVVLARLSYCAYIVHLTVIRISFADRDEVQRTSIYGTTMMYFFVLLASFALALPMYVLLEAPAGHVTKLCLDPKKTEKPAIADFTSSKETVEIKL